MKQLCALVSILLLMCAKTHSQNSAITLNGTWTTIGSSIEANFTGELSIDSNNKLQGKLRWTYLKIDRANSEYYNQTVSYYDNGNYIQIQRRKASGYEIIGGNYSKQNNRLEFKGIEKQDPAAIIGLDEYVIELKPEGKFTGKALGNNKDWSGQLIGTYRFVESRNTQNAISKNTGTLTGNIFENANLNTGLIAFWSLDKTLTSHNNKYIGKDQRGGTSDYIMDRYGNIQSALNVIPNRNFNGMNLNFSSELLPSSQKKLSYNFWIRMNKNVSPLFKELLVNGKDFFEDKRGTGGLYLYVSEDGHGLGVGLNKSDGTDTVIFTSWKNRRIQLDNSFDLGSINLLNALDGYWHMITYVFEGEKIQGFIDGVNILNINTIDLTRYLPFNSSYNIRIPGVSTFQGEIDDIAIFDRALNKDDIKDLLTTYKSGIVYQQVDISKRNNYLYKNKFWFNYCFSKFAFDDKTWKQKLEPFASNFNPYYLPVTFFEGFYSKANYQDFAGTDFENIMSAIQKRKQYEEIEEQKRKNDLALAETRRIAYLKKATVGDMMIYTQDWERNESYLFGFYKKNTPFTMIIKCYIERIEGEKFQVRIADVSSSDTRNYSIPDINGIKISKGDIIWIKPLKDRNWFWGEEN